MLVSHALEPSHQPSSWVLAPARNTVGAREQGTRRQPVQHILPAVAAMHRVPAYGIPRTRGVHTRVGAPRQPPAPPHTPLAHKPCKCNAKHVACTRGHHAVVSCRHDQHTSHQPHQYCFCAELTTRMTDVLDYQPARIMPLPPACCGTC